MSRERKQNIISLKEGRRGCGWVPSARWRKRVSSACPFSESSIHTWNTSWEPRGPSRWRITAPGEHRRESRFLKSPERQAHHLCQLHPWWAPLEGDACLWTGGWSSPPPGPRSPPRTLLLGWPLQPLPPRPPSTHRPCRGQATSSSWAPAPQWLRHKPSPAPGCYQGPDKDWRGGEKLIKRHEAALCGQSKSAVRNTASAAGEALGFRTPATEMVTVLTIPLLMCASDHHAGHLQYTCLLKNNI